MCMSSQQLKKMVMCAFEHAHSDHAGPTRDRTMGSEGLAGLQPMWDLDTAETTDSKKNVAALKSRWLSCRKIRWAATQTFKSVGHQMPSGGPPKCLQKRHEKHASMKLSRLLSIAQALAWALLQPAHANTDASTSQTHLWLGPGHRPADL